MPATHHPFLGATLGLLFGVGGILAAVWFKMRLLQRGEASRHQPCPTKDSDKLSW